MTSEYNPFEDYVDGDDFPEDNHADDHTKPPPAETFDFDRELIKAGIDPTAEIFNDPSDLDFIEDLLADAERELDEEDSTQSILDIQYGLYVEFVTSLFTDPSKVVDTFMKKSNTHIDDADIDSFNFFVQLGTNLPTLAGLMLSFSMDRGLYTHKIYKIWMDAGRTKYKSKSGIGLNNNLLFDNVNVYFCNNCGGIHFYDNSVKLPTSLTHQDGYKNPKRYCCKEFSLIRIFLNNNPSDKDIEWNKNVIDEKFIENGYWLGLMAAIANIYNIEVFFNRFMKTHLFSES